MTARLTPRIAILVDTSTGWGRRLIRGVLAFAKKHGAWDVWVEPRGQNEPLRLPTGWQGDGVIARIATQAMAEHLSEAATQVVNVSSILMRNYTFPRVTTNTQATVQLAIEHFTDRGIRHFGYVGLPHRAYSARRQHALVDACAALGFSCSIYVPRRGAGATAPWPQRESSLQDWLAELPKPVGILSWGVSLGIEVINSCLRAQLRVPDQVAVLGGDDDELLCEAVRPSLSGILVPSEQIGHEAAALLARMLAGKRPPSDPVTLPPTGVAARSSTDVLALDDPDVVAAIRHIRTHAHEMLRVQDVANAVAVSRRSLERRFQKALGRTIGDEISRVHLERAKLLLAQTELPIPQVANSAGFGSPEYLATVFRRTMGVSPLKYRSKARCR